MDGKLERRERSKTFIELDQTAGEVLNKAASENSVNSRLRCMVAARPFHPWRELLSELLPKLASERRFDDSATNGNRQPSR